MQSVFLNFYHLFCTYISLTLNSFLIYLILYKSSSKLGEYRLLMVFTAVFEQVYAVVNLLAAPTSFSYGHAFVIFRQVDDAWTNSSESQVLVVVWCTFFGGSMAVFGIHFIYRYATTQQNTAPSTSKFRSLGKNIYFLATIPFLFGIWWGFVCVMFCGYAPDTHDYIRNGTKALYNLEVEDISYITIVFYHDDPIDSSIHLNPRGWIALVQFFTMVSSSLFCVTVLGYCCYYEISQQLSVSTSTSSNSLQKQLFYAMVGQTVIPFCFMYLPISIFVFGSVFMIEVGTVSHSLTHAVTLYTVLDPLPNMFIIKNYRVAIYEIWRNLKMGKLCFTSKNVITVATVSSARIVYRRGAVS